MFFNLRRIISNKTKAKILNSFFYRLYSRLKLLKPEIRFSVELTTRCNAKCKMCTRQSLVDKNRLHVGVMDDLIVNNVIDQMKKFSDLGYEVVFTPMGLGEPLLYEKLYKVIERVKKYRIKVILVTNGILLNNKNIDGILNARVDEITVSLNTKNKNEYKKLMGVDGFDLVNKNLDLLFEKRNKKKSKLKIFIQFLGSQNDFDKQIRYWNNKMRNGDKCYVHSFVNQAGLVKNNSKNINYPCSQPLYRISIKINGDIYPCDPALYSGSDKFRELYLGNIMDRSVIKDFLDKNNKRYKILSMMKKENYSKIKCCQVCTTKGLSENCFFNISRLHIDGYKWF
ncbi:MAG: molybdenum cofactor biosynthesis protein A [Candidatus Dependentiae bacterium ADurb.Bin246]|nr:MAG: molybdenum cofactor biosynthesis protein A [Candidatus Dependentiae bacterium ADurb.Bin246]